MFSDWRGSGLILEVSDQTLDQLTSTNWELYAALPAALRVQLKVATLNIAIKWLMSCNKLCDLDLTPSQVSPCG